MEFIVISLVLLCQIDLNYVNGHGHLIVPPQRSSLWRTIPGAPRNVDDNGLNCGGFARQFEKNKGKCGVCGDAWDLPKPRPHENGGKYDTGFIAAVYKQGDIVDVVINITASHYGWFEMRLCTQDDDLDQDCFNDNTLLLADSTIPFSYGTTRYHVGKKRGVIKVQMKLPDYVTCERCVLQWKYRAGNSWGCDRKCCLGCGNQEHFYNCADIRIFPPRDQTHATPLPEKMTHALDLNYDITQQFRGEFNDEQRIHFYPSEPFIRNTKEKHKTKDTETDDQTLKEMFGDRAMKTIYNNDENRHLKIHYKDVYDFYGFHEDVQTTTQVTTLLSGFHEDMQKTTQVTTLLSCTPTPEWNMVKGMEEWCKLNCPTCPSSHCTCT